MLNRFHIDSPLQSGASVELTGSEHHHAAHVSRLRQGEEVELFNGSGRNVRARVEGIAKEAIRLTVLTDKLTDRESALEITLAMALIQPEKFEWVLQKGTELGVTTFLPMQSERTETRIERVRGKFERWERIVLEAVKQSGRSRIPRIADPVVFDDVLLLAGTRILFDSEAPATGPAQAHGAVVLMIGPEGGWGDRELAATVGRCQAMSLGPRRLRAETAALAAITLVQSRWGDLRTN